VRFVDPTGHQAQSVTPEVDEKEAILREAKATLEHVERANPQLTGVAGDLAAQSGTPVTVTEDDGLVAAGWRKLRQAATAVSQAVESTTQARVGPRRPSRPIQLVSLDVRSFAQQPRAHWRSRLRRLWPNATSRASSRRPVRRSRALEPKEGHGSQSRPPRQTLASELLRLLLAPSAAVLLHFGRERYLLPRRMLLISRQGAGLPTQLAVVREKSF
jgi:hypothetical protein